MAARFASFREFYPFCLSEHRNPTCRRLHFAGSTLVAALVAAAIATGKIAFDESRRKAPA